MDAFSQRQYQRQQLPFLQASHRLAELIFCLILLVILLTMVKACLTSIITTSTEAKFEDFERVLKWHSQYTASALLS